MEKIIIHRISTFLFLWFLFFILAGCYNSGGGASNEEGDENPAIEYSGLTTPALVTSENAKTIAMGSLLGLSQNTAMALGQENLPINRLYALYFSLVILQTTQNIDISNLNLSRTPEGIRTETITIDGNCNGTGTLVMNLNEAAETYEGTFIFSQYCENQITISGDTIISGTLDSLTGKIETITYEFEDLSFDDFFCRGEVYVDQSGATQIVVFDFLLKDSISGKVYWAKDYSVNISEITVTDFTIEFSGFFYDPDHGYAYVSTSDNFLLSTEDYPLWGMLLCVGRNDTKVKLTNLSSYSFRIDVDTQGNDEYNYSSDNLIWPGASPGPWQKKASLPTWQRGFAAVAVNDKILVLGGQNRSNTEIPVDKVEEYNPETNNWNPRASMPTPRYWLAAAALNGKVYAIGGSKYPGTWIDGPQPIQALNVVEEYDPATDTWAAKSGMKNRRMMHGAAAVNGKIYVIGGVLNNTPGPWIDTGLVESYDPMTESWETKSPMPTPRRSPEVAVIGDKIYVIGGLYPNDPRRFDYYDVIDAVEEYDPSTDSWDTKISIPNRRLNPACSAVADEIYVIGGSVYDSYDLNEKFMPLTNMWLSMSPIPVSGNFDSGVKINKKLYVIGSDNPQTVYEYDPALDF